jgi:hypothetical protein
MRIWKILPVELLSIITLSWQLFVLFACCLGAGLVLRSLIPEKFSPLNKLLFSLMGGLFLIVLIPQNLVYLGVPVRISAWLILGAALIHVGIFRQRVIAWTRAFSSKCEIRTLVVITLLTMTFHGIVPISQGLEWYYGKGHFDQINYVLLAEFLKEERYSMSEPDFGLRPWLVRPVGYQITAEQIGMSSGPGVEMVGLKKVRLGQSIVTAEISAWSGADCKGSYAATVIFFLSLLSICLYVFLREIGIDRFMAGSGAIFVALLPAVTRLSLDGFLSQASILFVFPFFASLLRHQELSARSFTLFFSLTIAYLIAAYSEIAPLGLCTLLLGAIFVRSDSFRSKRLMLMTAILLVALANPYYLRNLIGFLAQQYYFATNAQILQNLAPSLLTLRDWSELIFGTITAPFALFFDYSSLFLGFLTLAAVMFLSWRDRLIFGVILLPAILAILALAIRSTPAYYPIAKIILTFLPFVICLVFVTLSKVATSNQFRSVGILKKVLCGLIVAASAAGSAQYYFEVLDNGDLLRYVREPRFLEVCRKLEVTKNKRVFVFETHPLLTAWLCYHARRDDVYFDGRYISDSSLPLHAQFSKIPDLKNIDFVVTRDQIVDLSAPNLFCLTLVDDPPAEDRRNGRIRYWLGPPANLRFLALRTISATLKMRLAPGPEATTLPIDYFLTDRHGPVSQGEIQQKNLGISRINLPRGLSALELSAKAKHTDPNAETSFPLLAELDGIEISDIDTTPEK